MSGVVRPDGVTTIVRFIFDERNEYEIPVYDVRSLRDDFLRQHVEPKLMPEMLWR